MGSRTRRVGLGALTAALLGALIFLAPTANAQATDMSSAAGKAGGVSAAASRGYYFGTVQAYGDVGPDYDIHAVCWGYGQSYQGDTIWYENQNGTWYPGAVLDTGSDPNPNVPHYPTNCVPTIGSSPLIADDNRASAARPVAKPVVRTATALPYYWFGSVQAYGDLGADSLVGLTCWGYGQSYQGDTIWYKDTWGGWVPGAVLDTGADPNPNVPHYPTNC